MFLDIALALLLVSLAGKAVSSVLASLWKLSANIAPLLREARHMRKTVQIHEAASAAS